MTRKNGPVVARLSREAKLLLCCARPQLNSDAAAQLASLLALPLDWANIFYLAEWHRLRPLLAHHLSAFRWQLPDEVNVRLREFSLTHGRHALQMTTELLTIVQALETAGISALPYKGPALAQQCYGDFALREYVDLDLLVARKDVRAAEAVLGALHYRPETALADHHRKLYARSECDRVFLHSNHELHLEVHWAITPPCFGFPFAVEEFFADAAPLALNNVALRTLGPQQQLLALCANGAKEMWQRLEWIAAIAQLLSGPEAVELESVADSCRQRHSLRLLLLGVALAAELFQVALPATITADIKRDHDLPKLLHESYQRLFFDASERVGSLRLSAYRLRTETSLLRRVRYCMLRAFTPTQHDLRAVALPKGASALYYVVRPLRLLGQKLGATVIGSKATQSSANGDS